MEVAAKTAVRHLAFEFVCQNPQKETIYMTMKSRELTLREFTFGRSMGVGVGAGGGGHNIEEDITFRFKKKSRENSRNIWNSEERFPV